MDKKVLVLAGGAIAVIALIYLGFNAVTFRLVSAKPDNGTTVGNVQPVEFSFSQALDKSVADRFTIEPKVEGNVSVEGGKFTFKPLPKYDTGTEYTATLRQPRSSTGRTLDDVTVRFKVDFIPYEQLPSEQRDPRFDGTDQMEVDWPITQKLPYDEDDRFSIEYEILPGPKLKLVVRLYAIINRPDQYDEYRQQLKSYKQTAEAWIRQNTPGGNIGQYEIEWIPGEAAGL